ncbi:MAG: VOC family protein [Terriglobales bacterium]
MRAITRLTVATAVAAFALAACGGKGSAAAAAPRRPKILGIAFIHLRVHSAAAAQKIFHQELGFDRVFTLRGPAGPVIYYKVSEDQYLELTPGWRDGAQPRFMAIGFRTDDARALRAYLAVKGFAPGPLMWRSDGNLSFIMKDPEGHTVVFEQFYSGSRTGRLRGQLLSPRRLSRWIIHAGFVVQSTPQEDRLYRRALGFHPMWRGGMRPGVWDWVDRRTSEGPDWIEYMLQDGTHPSLRTRGVADHFSLGVLHMQQAYKELVARGWHPQQKPQIGMDGKWQLNLYTVAGTRIELMGPKPVRKPCCAPMLPGGW